MENYTPIETPPKHLKLPKSIEALQKADEVELLFNTAARILLKHCNRYHRVKYTPNGEAARAIALRERLRQRLAEKYAQPNC